MDVIINNQCADIELTSPVYFTKDAMSYIQFPQQVDSKSSVKIKFKIGISLDTSGGVLLYHLQRKEDTSISAQLLVIWGHKSNKLYSDVWLIEYESTLVWNEDKLKMLYDVYNIHHDLYYKLSGWLLDSTILEIYYRLGGWLLSDNTKLEAYYKLNGWLLENDTKLETMSKLSHGGSEMNIVISKRLILSPIFSSLLQKPLWVDPNK
jgi:hypothetical protein